MAVCQYCRQGTALSQNDELARVKLRIRALTERTVARGCTEAEAMTAAEMVGRLLQRYALSMDEVDVRREPCVPIEVPIGGQRRRPIDACVPALARFCDCKVWLARNSETVNYIFFGFETDTALAAYLFAVIERAISTELSGFRKRTRSVTGVTLRRASSSFQGGLASRVADRLDVMHTEREASVAMQRATGTALMLIRHQVVEAAFQAKNVRLRSLPGLSLRRNAAFRAGQEAGERVNLRPPIETGETGLLI